MLRTGNHTCRRMLLRQGKHQSRRFHPPEPNWPDWLRYRTEIAEFGFDKDSLRFQVTHIGGYVTQGEDIHWRATDPKSYNETQRSIDPIAHPDDAFFEIGTCRPF
jgi:hypothetical protein